jgi:hypothetical protein
MDRCRSKPVGKAGGSECPLSRKRSLISGDLNINKRVKAVIEGEGRKAMTLQSKSAYTLSVMERFNGDWNYYLNRSA